MNTRRKDLQSEQYRTNLVGGAGMVIKWLLGEPGTDRAETLKDSLRLGKHALPASQFLVVEVGNVIMEVCAAATQWAAVGVT